MNERIRNFAIQAERHALSVCGFCHHSDYSNVRDAKFTELIVRECLNKVNEAVYAREMSGRYYPDSDGKKILKHFGVEE